MTVDLVVMGGRVYVEGSLFEAGVAVDDGRIVKVAKEAHLPNADLKVNASGLLVLPGLIDCHVHLRDQGLAYKEDFYTGTCSAAVGGITSVLDMPNNVPPTNSKEALLKRMERARNRVVVNVGFYVAPPEKPEALKDLLRLGAFGVKLNLLRPIGGVDLTPPRIVKVLGQASECSIPALIHAEDRFMVMERSPKDLYQLAKAHTIKAERKSVAELLTLNTWGAKLHFCHLTSSTSISLVCKARRSRIPVTCEVTPHHLLLGLDSLKKHGAIAFYEPPLRGLRSVIGLQRRVASGDVDVIASDHAPHDPSKDKEVEDPFKVAPGSPGLEVMVPLVMTLVTRGLIGLERAVAMMSENPARIFGIKRKGSVKPGYDADLTLVDMKLEGVIDPAKFKSKAKYSPFKGWRVKGLPVITMVAGRVLAERGEVYAKGGEGRILRRSYCG
ncbi:MAG: dihydroorotase family protein [Candidatus Nezhaarchaeales archaeon]